MRSGITVRLVRVLHPALFNSARTRVGVRGVLFLPDDNMAHAIAPPGRRIIPTATTPDAPGSEPARPKTQPGQRSGWFAVSELSTQNVNLAPIRAQRRRNSYASPFCAGSHIGALIGGNSTGNPPTDNGLSDRSLWDVPRFRTRLSCAVGLDRQSSCALWQRHSHAHCVANAQLPGTKALRSIP